MAEQQPEPLSAECIAAVQRLVEDGFPYWRDNSTDEQRAKGLEEMHKFENDEAWTANLMEEIKQQFAAADVNNNQRLERAEYAVFITAMKASSKARGNFEDDRPETVDQAYDAENLATPGVEGVTEADMDRTMMVFMEKFNEMKTAAGL